MQFTSPARGTRIDNTRLLSVTSITTDTPEDTHLLIEWAVLAATATAAAVAVAMIFIKVCVTQ